MGRAPAPRPHPEIGRAVPSLVARRSARRCRRQRWWLPLPRWPPLFLGERDFASAHAGVCRSVLLIRTRACQEEGGGERTDARETKEERDEKTREVRKRRCHGNTLGRPRRLLSPSYSKSRCERKKIGKNVTERKIQREEERSSALLGTNGKERRNVAGRGRKDVAEDAERRWGTIGRKGRLSLSPDLARQFFL